MSDQIYSFLTIIAWAFGVLAALRFIACFHGAITERRMVLQNAYYLAAGKALLLVVVCAAWIIAT